MKADVARARFRPWLCSRRVSYKGDATRDKPTTNKADVFWQSDSPHCTAPCGPGVSDNERPDGLGVSGCGATDSLTLEKLLGDSGC